MTEELEAAAAATEEPEPGQEAAGEATLEQRVLDAIRSGFPLQEDPYGELARQLEATPDDVKAVVGELCERGVIRRIGASFAPRALGYESSLCALQVMDPQRQLGRSISAVNSFPQVTRNCGRLGRYNLWFTVTTRSVEERRQVLAQIRKQVFTPGVLDLPAVTTYKTGVDFGRSEPQPAPADGAAAAPDEPGAPFDAADVFDVELVRWAQEDAGRDADGALLDDPFAAGAQRVAQALGRDVTPAELLARVRQLKAQGAIRRFGAMVRRRELGFACDALCAWKIDPARIDEAGAAISAMPFVSHCCRREPSLMFDRSLFATVHARSEEEMEACVRQMREALEAAGIESQAMDRLPTGREHKQVSARYFVEDE